jgi:hypothetical protein
MASEDKEIIMPDFTKEELLDYARYADANNPARNGSVIFSVKRYIQQVETTPPSCYLKGWLQKTIGKTAAIAEVPLRDLPLLIHGKAKFFVKWRLGIGK